MDASTPSGSSFLERAAQTVLIGAVMAILGFSATALLTVREHNYRLDHLEREIETFRHARDQITINTQRLVTLEREMEELRRFMQTPGR